MEFFMRRRSHASMKKLYDRIHPYYGKIELGQRPLIERIVKQKISLIPGISQKTALEYACGSGLLTQLIAPLFKSVHGRDVSAGMLSRAPMHFPEELIEVTFSEGDILNPDEAPRSYDYVLVCFGLHLFSPEQETEILRRLLEIAREAVIIIDHGRTWSLKMAFIEWIEGSWYDRFIKQDFAKMARDAGASHIIEENISDCLYLTLYPAHPEDQEKTI